MPNVDFKLFYAEKMSSQPNTLISTHDECGANQMAQSHKSQNGETNPSREQSSIHSDKSANCTGSGM